MKYATFASLALAVSSLGLAACNKNTSNSPQDRPPAVSGDATPAVRSEAPAASAEQSTSSGAMVSHDATAAPTTGESVAGTGDTRPASKVVDDAWITTKTKTALLAEADLKAASIQVETRRGVVMLTGKVPSAAQSTKATTVARGIEGVTSVENNLTVQK